MIQSSIPTRRLTPTAFLQLKFKFPASINSVRILLVICMLMIMTGCTTRVSPEYGISEGFTARRSPGGLSAFRNMTEASGSTTYTVRSLSPANKERLDAIVWIPDSFAAHKVATFDWLDQWMLDGDKTLVYVGRDYSPIADYWRKTSTSRRFNAPAANLSLAALEEAARYEAILDGERASVRSKIPTPWFMIEYQSNVMKKVTAFTGEWSDASDLSNTNIYVRGTIETFTTSSASMIKKALDWEPEINPVTPIAKTTYGEQWTSADVGMLEIANKINENDVPLVTTLLASDDGTPLITLLESNNWAGSRVIHVANASLLCNLGLTHRGNRQIADSLISEFWGQTVGFISESSDPNIRKDNNLEQQKGFEMLTVWPLNVITIHAVFAGLLVLLAVFPIFGRPQTIPKVSNTDFALHVDAVGMLLRKAGDRFYALSTIADYFKLVRKDTTSPWASVDELHVQRVDSPFASPTTSEKPAQPPTNSTAQSNSTAESNGTSESNGPPESLGSSEPATIPESKPATDTKNVSEPNT